MKKVIIIISIIVLIILVGGFAFFFFFMWNKGPLYNPTDLSKAISEGEIDINPPEQDNSNHNKWKVTDNISLFHFSDGNGEPVLMLHGGPGYAFDEKWKALSMINETYEFIYYHQRGCGKSTKPVKSFDGGNYYQNMLKLSNELGFKPQLADIERIRKILGEEKLTLIGHSFGGFLATLYAIEFPEKVDALVLVSPADVVRITQEGGGSLFEKVEANLPKNRKKDFRKFMNEKYFGVYKDLFSRTEQELIDIQMEFSKYYIEAVGDADYNLEDDNPELYGGWMTYAMYLDMGQEHDYTEYLKNIDVPVLIIVGEDDILENTHADYVKYIPSDKLEVQTIKDSTHFAFNEQSEVFSSIVKSFFDKHVE